MTALRHPLLACLLGSLLVACHAYDAGKLMKGSDQPDTDAGRTDGGGGSDGGADGAVVDDGGPEACVPEEAEACNRLDDDCDGDTDEDTLAACEAQVVNAETECVAFAMTARCVLVRCRDGFDNCDGDPSNGCEDYCSCNECPDAGTEDAGN